MAQDRTRNFNRFLKQSLHGRHLSLGHYSPTQTYARMFHVAKKELLNFCDTASRVSEEISN